MEYRMKVEIEFLSINKMIIDKFIKKANNIFVELKEENNFSLQIKKDQLSITFSNFIEFDQEILTEDNFELDMLIMFSISNGGMVNGRITVAFLEKYHPVYVISISGKNKSEVDKVLQKLKDGMSNTKSLAEEVNIPLKKEIELQVLPILSLKKEIKPQAIENNFNYVTEQKEISKLLEDNVIETPSVTSYIKWHQKVENRIAFVGLVITTILGLWSIVK